MTREEAIIAIKNYKAEYPISGYRSIMSIREYDNIRDPKVPYSEIVNKHYEISLEIVVTQKLPPYAENPFVSLRSEHFDNPYYKILGFDKEGRHVRTMTVEYSDRSMINESIYKNVYMIMLTFERDYGSAIIYSLNFPK